jgi:hypothetical protein
MQYRPLRFPFLVAAKAIAPLDNSGLVQSPERLTNHLITAHHDAVQFAYDVEILKGTEGALERARAATLAVIDGTDPRGERFRDLCVYEGYHERLLATLDDAIAGLPLAPPEQRDDPDITFQAFIRWCLAQPTTPTATFAAWRTGAFPAPIASLEAP